MQNHIKHILVAEFDIDKGSQLSHQYPEKTGIEEHKLAELMLPDGAHLREEDWTFFILNQHVIEDSTTNLSEQQEGYISKGFENFQPVISVCCFTYNDDSWNRIIESDEVFIHLLQDKILLINRYLKLIGEIKPDVIINYQDDINDYTVKLITKSKIYGFRFFNEEDYRLALITFRSLLYQRPPLNTEDSDFPELPLPSVNNEGNALYVLNLVRTKQIPGVRRGARVKAIAITSHHKWLHVFKPLLIMALDNYFETPELFIIEQLYKSMNSLDISLMPLLSLNEKIILRASDDPMLFNESFVDMEEFAKIMNKYNVQLKNNQIRKIDRHFFETNVLYDNGNKNPVKVPIKIPMTMFNGEFGDLSVIQLISTFGNSAYPTKHHPQLDNNIPTNPIIILINALLTQKRVLFLGHLKPSGEVANFVLAACALGSCGILRGYTERCFPYTNLAGLDDLLKVPGYIAGVTNPAFEEHPQWWDVLFNINTGKVTISPNIEKASPVENPLFSINEKELLASSMDKEFMNDIMSLIQQKYGEHYIRERFRLYLIRFIEVASEYERIVFNRTKIGYSHETIHDKYKIGVGAYFPDDLSKHREIAYNINRIEGWRKTRSYELYVKDFHKNMLRRSVRCVDIRRQALALRNEVSISDEQLSGIMTALAENISTDEQVLEFLTHFLHNQGGLLPIAYPLLHKSESIRINCTKVLVRLDYSPVGTRILSHLNPFFKLAYEKSAQKYEKRWGKNWYLASNEAREILQNPNYNISDNPLTSPGMNPQSVGNRTSSIFSNSIHNLTDNKLHSDDISSITLDSQNKPYSNQRKGSVPKIMDNYSLPVPPRQVESNSIVKVRVKSKSNNNNSDDSSLKSGKLNKGISSPDVMRSPYIKKGSPLSSPSQNYKVRKEKSNSSTPASINSNRSRSNSYKNNNNNNSISNIKSNNSVSTNHSRNKSYDLSSNSSSDSDSESDLISNDDLDDEEVLKNINKHIQNDISYCDVLEDDLINLYNVNSSKEISEESRIYNETSLEMSKMNIDDSKISQPINLDDNSLFSDRINYSINNSIIINSNNNNSNNNSVNNINSNNHNQDNKNNSNVNNINNNNNTNNTNNTNNINNNNKNGTSTSRPPNNGMVFSARKDSFNHPYGDHADIDRNILFSNRKDDLKNINNLSTDLFSEEDEDIEGYSRAYSVEKYNNSKGTIENSYLDGTFSSFTTTMSHSPTLSTDSSITNPNDKGKNKDNQGNNGESSIKKEGIYHFGQYGNESGVQSSDVDLSNSHLIPDYDNIVKDDKLVIPNIAVAPTSSNPVIQKILQKQQLSIQKFNNMDSF